MELKEGKISIMVNEDRTTIEVMDSMSGIVFVKATLTPEQLSMALSRLHRVPCEKLEVFGLEHVGLKRELVHFQFEHPFEHMSNSEIEKKSDKSKQFIELVKEETLKQFGEGWEPSLYFGSQNSFYRVKDKNFARTYAVRWVKPEEGEQKEGEQ